MIAEHSVYGCDRIGPGWYSFDPEKSDICEKFEDTFRPVARKISGSGKLFMHHNHDQEFKKIGGRRVIEKLMEDFSTAEIGFTLDTFWVQASGGNPAQWLEKPPTASS